MAGDARPRLSKFAKARTSTQIRWHATFSVEAVVGGRPARHLDADPLTRTRFSWGGPGGRPAGDGGANPPAGGFFARGRSRGARRGPTPALPEAGSAPPRDARRLDANPAPRHPPPAEAITRKRGGVRTRS